MIRLANKSLELLLHEPQDGYYRGTRFDRSGIAGGISWHGIQMAGSWFSRILGEGESVYMGDIHRKGEEGMPYCISLSEGPLGVEIKGDVPVLHTVFWANHRVACPEPYNAFYPGCCWTITYRIYEK